MNLNRTELLLTKYALVSVPARGIMNLNMYVLLFVWIISFRPRSGNYESELLVSTAMLGSSAMLFPSPLGELWIWIVLCTANKISVHCFRPRSGNYESELPTKLRWLCARHVSVPARGIMNLNFPVALCVRCWQGFRPRSGNYESESIVLSQTKNIRLFPSPLGELWIWINPLNTFNYFVNLFPSPLGELWIWMTGRLHRSKRSIAVSVPARGIMNLNDLLLFFSFFYLRFRPRSGNYESEWGLNIDTVRDSIVSVPARGIMNLNGVLNIQVSGTWYVSVPARGIMNLNSFWICIAKFFSVSVPARGIMNLNSKSINAW